MTPHGHFTSLTKKLKRFERYRDESGLKTYIAGPAWEHLAGLGDDPERRWIALCTMIEVTAKLDTRVPLPRPGDRRVTWDAPTISRFRRALAKGGIDEAAHDLGITRGAARVARSRYGRDADATTRLGKRA